MYKKKTQNRKTGNLGEEVASKFLLRNGYKIIERNYWKKWGEIDIIAQKDNILHFIEVKSVTRETSQNVSDETSDHRPEDNVHVSKLAKLATMTETYLADKDVSSETDWQIDIICVYLNMKTRKARVEMLEDIII